MEQTETRIDQVFSMQRDPADTVEAYSTVALAAGWRLTFEGCSRAAQVTGRAFSRVVNGQSSTMSIRAELGTAPESTRHKPTLTVSIVAGRGTDPVYPGTRRNDLRCLDGLDPSTPELAVPELDHVTPEALCAAVNLDGIQGVTERDPMYGERGDSYGSACWFRGGVGVGTTFEVAEAGQPLAYYQDRSSVDAAPGQPFLFSNHGLFDFDGTGVWVPSAHGPLVVRANEDRARELGIGPEQLLRVAGDVAHL